MRLANGHAIIGIGLAGTLVLVLWLTADLTVPPRYLPYDSLLFVNWAASLREGKWLGDYTIATLSKVPGSGLWLFGLGTLGLRVIAVEQLLHWAAAALLTLLVWRRGLRTPVLIGFGAMLALSPEVFSSSGYSLVRDFLYDTLTLLLIGACGMTLYLWRWRSFLTGAVLLAALGCGYALLREEAAWFVPTYLLFLLLYAARHSRNGRRGRETALRVGLLLLLPGLAIGVSFAQLARQNARHYGAAGVAVGTVGANAFDRLVQALERIDTGEARRPRIPVSRAALEKACAASPALSEICPDLERMIARITSNEGAYLFVEHGTLPTSSLYWGIASAAAGHGHFASAAASAAFFQKAVGEIEAACGNGTLTCRPPPAYSLKTWIGAVAHGAAIVAVRTVVPDFLEYAEEFVPVHPGMLPFFVHVTGDVSPVAAYRVFDEQTGFDADYYARTYPDSGANPRVQYAVHGVDEARKITAANEPPFDPARYIADRPELRNAAATPLQLHLELDRPWSPSFTYGGGPVRRVLRRGLGVLFLLYSPFFLWGIRSLLRRGRRAAVAIGTEPQQCLRYLMLLTASAICVRALLLTYLYGFVFDNRDTLRYMMPLYGLYVCFCAAAVARRGCKRP